MLPIAKPRPPMPTLAGMGVVREGMFPWKYTVALFKPGVSEWGGFVVGSVVTHLSIRDWCTMHGYQLLEKSSTAPALSHEQTALH